MPKVPRLDWKSLERREKVRFAIVACGIYVLAVLFIPLVRACILMQFATQTTTGAITREVDPKNHNYLTYEYRVGGKIHTGMGYAPNHAELRQGEAIAVHYFPPLPSESVIASRHEQRPIAATGLIFGLLMAILAACGDYWNSQRNQRNQRRSTSVPG